jgi:hypothetical protein
MIVLPDSLDATPTAPALRLLHRVESEGMMPPRVFRLNGCTFAILSENDQRTAVTIPPNALVTIVLGDIAGDGFIKIRYRQKVLIMLALDLRSRGERILHEQQSA